MIFAVLIGTVAGSYYLGYDIGYERATNVTPPAVTPPLTEAPKPEPITVSDARELINNCRAEGTYRLRSGETGLLMKGSIFQPVTNTSEEELRGMQKPECPLTKTTTE